MCSKLINTCETHKDFGMVSFRPVHSSSMHAFTGLMSWVCLVLSETLNRQRHLISSSDQLISQLEDIVVEENDILYHADLKDFFMTGTRQFLT